MITGFAGLILAGGIGERWGGPKAWARMPGGRFFLEACSETIRAAGAGPIVATLPPGSCRTKIDGLEILVLPQDGLDMFASLCCGLERLAEIGSWSSVIVLPVDHPLVRVDTIRRLVKAGNPVSIPTLKNTSGKNKHGHPLALVRGVAERITSGELPGPTLREVVRAVGGVDVMVDDPGVCINCNTPEVLDQACTDISD